jgi:N-acetylglucosaminyldiphosphoundecaprenol N-acetyl-beta-D-mannosaminyltransferase
LKVVGARHGYFPRPAEAEIVEEINRLSPDFVWVGLGTPKQQRWIHDAKTRLRRGVLFAVGFAFDVNAGTKRDAPMWMQRVGLTWVFRACSEPRRLGPRYLRYNSLFLFYLVWDALHGRAFAPPKDNVPPSTGGS